MNAISNRGYFFAILFSAVASLSVASGAAGQERALITLDGVEIFSLPMIDSAPVAVLMKGDTVRVIGQRGDWVKVELLQGQKGWMQVQVRMDADGTVRKASPRVRRRGEAYNGQAVRDFSASADGRSSVFSGEVATAAEPPPDEIRDVRLPVSAPERYRRFGYAFGMGLLETDFTYSWRFVFHQTPRLALEGSFKHTLGGAADSYFIMANFSYLLTAKKKPFLPFATAGMGIINTVPERSIDTGGVSNMAINYGVGARKFFKKNLTLVFNATIYTVFVGKGMSHFKELTAGLMVGKFWD